MSGYHFLIFFEVHVEKMEQIKQNKQYLLFHCTKQHKNILKYTQ